jgi:hypothetical protein
MKEEETKESIIEEENEPLISNKVKEKLKGKAFKFKDEEIDGKR